MAWTEYRENRWKQGVLAYWVLPESLVCFWGCIRTAWESGPVDGGAVTFDRPTCPIWTQWSLCKKHVDICRNTVLLACVPQFDTMHPSMSLGAFFNDRNFRRLSGKYPQAYGNIATPKLIQCKIAEMPENKPFHGFRHFVFSVFEPFFRFGSCFALRFCTSF